MELVEKKSVELAFATLERRSSRVLELQFKDFMEVGYRDIRLLIQAIEKLQARDTLLLIQYGQGIFITNEARIEFTQASTIRAAAFLTYTDTATLLAHFLIRFSEPVFPMKVFSSRKLALAWLKQNKSA